MPAFSSDAHRYDVILDAGHGGADGGAVSAAGVAEAPINLEIARYSEQFMVFLGFRVCMTRRGEESLDHSPENTIRQNKIADLKARLAISERLQGVPFLSIHLNFFSDPKYRGAQVFCSGTEGSRELGEALQRRLIESLDKNNERVSKAAPEGIFLMDNARSAAVTIECGFLSNPGEAELLNNAEYQKKIALAIASGFSDHFFGG